MCLDVSGGGELAVARAVDFPMDRVIVHGNNKTPQELREAIEAGVGRIVVDSRLSFPACLQSHKKWALRRIFLCASPLVLRRTPMNIFALVAKILNLALRCVRILRLPVFATL